ncbi:MAG TPA: hypothetical protein VF412_00530 [Bdellovibrio sp.]|uniref:hypothetical protein n=1 Tax=Bdellovibrio sp. TaxID=28201 RepID=UPI002EF48090
MKILTLIFVLSSLASFAHAGESACSNEDCVGKKNAAMAAVFNFLYNEDSCVNSTQWVKAITKMDDVHFTAICGTESKSVTLKLKATPQEGSDSEGDFLVEIAN